MKNRSGLVDSILVVASDEPYKLGIQKHLFLHQLIHNMMTDCSLNYKFSTKKLQAQYMLHTQIVVSCPELVIQSFVILWVRKCKNRYFWKRISCIFQISKNFFTFRCLNTPGLRLEALERTKVMMLLLLLALFDILFLIGGLVVISLIFGQTIHDNVILKNDVIFVLTVVTVFPQIVSALK